MSRWRSRSPRRPRMALVRKVWLLRSTIVALVGLVGLVGILSTAGMAAAPQQDVAPPAPEAGDGVIQITSPLGRTGLVTKERIVARVHAHPGTVLSSLSFY